MLFLADNFRLPTVRARSFPSKMCRELCRKPFEAERNRSVAEATGVKLKSRRAN
jgi:hypothetical protein